MDSPRRRRHAVGLRLDGAPDHRRVPRADDGGRGRADSRSARRGVLLLLHRPDERPRRAEPGGHCRAPPGYRPRPRHGGSLGPARAVAGPGQRAGESGGGGPESHLARADQRGASPHPRGHLPAPASLRRRRGRAREGDTARAQVVRGVHLARPAVHRAAPVRQGARRPAAAGRRPGQLGAGPASAGPRGHRERAVGRGDHPAEAGRRARQ